MLQSTEYQVGQYLKWFWRTKDFSQVAHRRELDKTRRARLLLFLLGAGMGFQAGVGLACITLGMLGSMIGGVQLGFALLISYPVVWAHLIVVPLELARQLVVKPKERQLIARSRHIFGETKAIKIAVAGSYGKTTMKELLATVLSAGKKVAATPGNKNVSVSHAAFAARLVGDEEVLIIEYGEGQPGDVRKYAEYTTPDIGVITGVAPAHLDKYKTLEAAAKDIFDLAEYLQVKPVYVNAESPAAKLLIKDRYQTYSVAGIDGWKVSDVKQTIHGLTFRMTKGKKVLKLKSGLLGRHLVGPLACVAALADSLGLTPQQIEQGVSNTKPYEHRMAPYAIRGAWIIDDTYNGNLEGVRAGLSLLTELDAKRKIYVTPGLVEQGAKSAEIHAEIGKLIAVAKPDKVVLMNNSATKHIHTALLQAGYAGDIQTENDPLAFYTNLDQIVANGDLVLMQNDWTDNYA
ncbi:MAG: UDP-N-acetylmuramoyl-tripeptide--D-alanyl-D-alanine ligase [Candidatus Saccharibacteria bacterium]|nr:UDP-N-acetylmuramoyl-tripeptide--D-alanyl-D-alanine ligase [Candidatus Saccharibacteria bacterium]